MSNYATRSYPHHANYPPAHIGEELPRHRRCFYYNAIKAQRSEQLKLIDDEDPTYLQIIAEILDPEQGWLDRAREQLVNLESRENVLREEAWRRGRRTSQQEREMRQREEVIDKEDREARMRSSIAKNGEERRAKLRPKRKIVRFIAINTEDAAPPETEEQLQTATLLRGTVEREITENGNKRIVSHAIDTTGLSPQESSYIIADEAERIRMRLHWIEFLAAAMNACEAYDVENGKVAAIPATYGPHCIEGWALHIATLETLALEHWAWQQSTALRLASGDNSVDVSSTNGDTLIASADQGTTTVEDDTDEDL